MSEPRLKYRIKSLLAMYSNTVAAKKREKIIKACGVEYSTFSRWVNATENEPLDIPGYQLMVIANCLQVTVEELYDKGVANTAINNIKQNRII